MTGEDKVKTMRKTRFLPSESEMHRTILTEGNVADFTLFFMIINGNITQRNSSSVTGLIADDLN